MKARQARQSGKPALDLIEEATHLLRPEQRIAGQFGMDRDPEYFRWGKVFPTMRTASFPQKAEKRRIPEAFPFERVPGLSREMVQRFSETRPETLGQAQRIPGVTPAAVAVVGAYLDRF